MKLAASDITLIKKISDRAVKLARSLGATHYKVDNIALNLAVCHSSGTALDLNRLLAFRDGDFGHDVFGINRNLDPLTGELKNCFLPRCAKL